MRRYFIRFSYIGTQYSGMQKNAIPTNNVQIYDTDTIQGAIECAFSTIMPKCIEWPRLTCSSRTDAGVHSCYNAAHIDLRNKQNTLYNPTSVLANINRYFIKCHHQIRLLEFIPVKDDFHARVFAKGRTYVYRCLKPKIENEHRIPILEMQQSLHIRSPDFDIERVKAATQLFVGEKDFSTFSSKTKSDKKIKYVRTLERFTLEKANPLIPHDPFSTNFEYWNFVCSGKSFLYNQVRRMVGSLIALGLGKITERDIKIMLQVPGHHNWLSHAKAVPSYGLCLVKVDYSQEEIDEYTIKDETYPETETNMLIDTKNAD